MPTTPLELGVGSEDAFLVCWGSARSWGPLGLGHSHRAARSQGFLQRRRRNRTQPIDRNKRATPPHPVLILKI